MAKTQAPLLSFGAEGTIAKTAVYSKWRGVPYVRQRVIPANPRTTAQQNNRSLFASMRALWKIAPAGMRSPWDAFATGRPFTGMNAFLGQNIAALQSQSDLTAFIASPGARGGFPIDNFAAVGGVGSGEIDVTITAPTLPAGWAVTDSFATAILDFNPTTLAPGVITIGSDPSAPYAITLSGLTSASTYAVSGWLSYSKPNGDTAYSVSQTLLVAAT